MAKTNPFLGSWRITEMELWPQDAVDLVEPGFIRFDADGMGEFRFIAVHGWLDCRFGERDGRPLADFSWDDNDEGDQRCGRGWAVLSTADTLTGRIFFHRGDDSAFTASRGTAPVTKQRRRRSR